MFGKGEKKRRGRGGSLAVGALATVGAISIFKKGKRWMKDVSKKMMGLFKGDSETDESD